MKKVLVTGAGGFIGSHLVEKLVTLGLNVRAFLHYNSRSDWGWLENSSCKNEVEVQLGDLRDYDSVSQAVKNCDTIFHLGALIGIPYSYISPLAYLRTNVEGTYNILQAGKEFGAEKVLITSTSETYGTAQYVPMDEKHPSVGQSPYSASKISADQLTTSYHRSFGMPVTIVRPFNTYGPRQSDRAVIPTIISQILSGKPVSLGNLTPTRDLTFVEDTARAFIAIAKTTGLDGEVLNVGMGSEISIGDLADLIVKLLGTSIKIEGDRQRIRPGPSEVERLFCDPSKLKKLTNWKPEETLESGLKKTIEWFKKHTEYYKPDRYQV